MQVQEVMSRNPYSADATTTIAQVMRLIAEADVRHVPIVDEGALVGIVSDRDLRGLMPSVLDELDRPRDVRRTFAQPVTTIMSSDVLSTYPESDLAEAVDLMIEWRIGAIPVVEPDSLKLVGIISYVDALRAARDLL
ncbi:MAG TPA: CBS domain-containing protein [Polyangiaceae bacterium]